MIRILRFFRAGTPLICHSRNLLPWSLCAVLIVTCRFATADSNVAHRTRTVERSHWAKFLGLDDANTFRVVHSKPTQAAPQGLHRFPKEDEPGIFVTVLGHEAEVFIVPSSSPDSKDGNRALVPTYARGRTPLFIPKMPPGDYHVWIRFTKPIPCKYRRYHPQFGGFPVSALMFDHNSEHILSCYSKATVQSDTLLPCFFNFLPVDGTQEVVDRLYPNDSIFPVDEPSLRQIFRETWIPDEELPHTVNLLRRGGAVSVGGRYFIMVVPGDNHFSVHRVGVQQPWSNRVGFPHPANRGLYISTLGQTANVYIVPVSSQNVNNADAATSAKYFYGRTPLFLPEIEAGTYRIWLTPDYPIPYSEATSKEILQFDSSQTVLRVNEKTFTVENVISQPIEIKANQFEFEFVSLIPATATAQEIDSLYPRTENYSVEQENAWNVISKQGVADPDIPRFISLLRRGGAVTIRPGLFLMTGPGGLFMSKK